MEVQLIGMKKVRMSITGNQGVMIIAAFGDILVSESFAVTTSEMARKLNKHIKAEKLPEITGWGSFSEPKIIFRIKL